MHFVGKTGFHDEGVWIVIGNEVVDIARLWLFAFVRT